MNPITNPYAPGAGCKPPALAGRDALREKVRIGLARLLGGRQAKSVIMVGLRGVGKTVLLNQMQQDADASGIYTIYIEAPEERSLPALLAPQMRLTLLRLSRVESAKEYAIRGLRALAGFVSGLKLSYADIEVGLDYEPEAGLADNGDLESDLSELVKQVGVAARMANTAVVIFIDELQYVAEKEMAALISALHRASQAQLPITVIGAGLPQLRGRAGNAKSYAERLFDYPEIGPLDQTEATTALVQPAHDEGVEIEPAAVELIIHQTRGYPYFLQEWGSHAWDIAAMSPITRHDVEVATQEVIAKLDESFFRVRFERMTEAERRYLRAMAELGPGPHRSGDIADELHRTVQSLGPIRSSLINKGMIWSPNHGGTAFTVPLFDEFMRRIMPDPEALKE